MMWVILPVKHLAHGKARLQGILSDEQRQQLGYLLLVDTLQTLAASAHVQGVTLISSDEDISQLADRYYARFILTEEDRGFAEDAMTAADSVQPGSVDKVAILPADLPCLCESDLELLDTSHTRGITLCEAKKDGGTNALVFTPPLSVPLLFGPDSFNRHRRAAMDRQVEVNTVVAPGLERDIDREEDLIWLSQQPGGAAAWKYTRDIMRNSSR